MSERKRIILELARGGFITASRVVPFPHAYRLVTIGVQELCKPNSVPWVVGEEIDEAEAQRLVDLKWIAGKASDALWDRIRFDVAQPLAVMVDALSYHATGYGDCPVCAQTFGLNAAGKISRHGFAKLPDGGKLPACEGSGKEPVRPIYPLKVNEHAA